MSAHTTKKVGKGYAYPAIGHLALLDSSTRKKGEDYFLYAGNLTIFT